MRDVRIWFQKQGLIKYISHLDLMRTFTRAIRRTEIPLWFTEGFNPHPYLAFALPLSLGMESINDSLDIRIEGNISNDEIQRSLAAVMPEGLHITAVSDPVMKQKEITFAEFEILFSPASYELSANIQNLLSSDEIIVQKLSKQGRRKVMKDVNFAEHIQKYTLSHSVEAIILNIILPAGSSKNMNPELLAKKISQDFSCLYSSKRLNLFNEKMQPFK